MPADRPQRRRVRTQRSFVTVLCGLAAFIALQLGLAVVFEIKMPEVRDPLYGRRLRYVQKSLRAEPAKPWTVIMLGTSRAVQGFRPGAIEKTWGDPAGRRIAAFNFGVNGGGPLTESLIWRRLQQDGVRPDLLLVEVMPALLCSQTFIGDFHPAHWPTTRLRWQDLALVKHYAEAIRPSLRRDWLAGFTLPCRGQRRKLMNIVCPELLPHAYVLAEGWNVDESGELSLKVPTPEERRRYSQLNREGYERFLTGFRLGGSGCDGPRELMASCRKEGVPAALVFMPEAPSFRSWYSPETLRDVQQFVTQLGRENAAPVIDAREWMGEDDFMDFNHLLPGAAEEFTDRRGREYILPLLRQRKETRR